MGSSPIGLDYDYLQQLYDELDELLEDESINEDNEEIHKRISGGMGWMEFITHHVVISVACVILFVMIPLISVALFRHVFVTKAASLIISTLMSIAANSMPLLEENATYNYKYQIVFNRLMAFYENWCGLDVSQIATF